MPAPTIFNAATGQLVHAAAITDPTGGVTVDAEARTATNAVLGALRSAGVIAGATSMTLGHVFNLATRQIALGPAIAAPAGGATIDAEARTAINSIRTVLQNAAVIAGATTTLAAFALDEDEFSLKRGAAIIAVAGGATVDAECRTAVNAALAGMRLSPLIALD